MMDRNYPSSSFADALAPPAQTVASWAYDRGSATIKPSPSYGATYLDAELLQRQSYTTTHQLPTYTTSHIPVATGANSSTTELYLTGALPSTATFPSTPALSSCQHTGAYPTRSYATNPSLTLQDPAFSTSTNGLFSHHDPLLHLKSNQTVLPTALAFNHLSASALGSPLPVQSSTYRSAQESAPHLLQPQFSLLPSTLSATHSANQPFGATVFSGSIERALQRECSVIKHHQRPSSIHIASEQLPSSEQSLQGYFGSGSEADVSYQQEPSHQPSVSCNPSTGADSSQAVSGSLQPKTDCTTQVYSSTSLQKTNECSSKLAPQPAGNEEMHSQNLSAGSPERYSSPGLKQNSVIINQEAVQLSSLISNTLSQTYITPHTQSQASNSTSNKLSSLYDTLPSLSSQSDNVASISQSLVYSSTPGLNQEQGIQYGAQVQSLCQGNLSESYPTSHSQGASNVIYTSQSQVQNSVTQSQSFITGESLNSSFPPTCAQSLPTSSTVDYTLMQASVGGKTHDTLSHQQHSQPNTYVLSAPLPTYSSAAQALQNNITSIQDIKPTYGKQKLEEVPLQGLEALRQVSVEASITCNSIVSHNNVIYVVSKMDDHPKAQSVIRSSSRSDDQIMGLRHVNTVPVKDERMGSLSQQHIHLTSANGHETSNTKTTDSTIESSHIPLCSEPLKQHPLQLESAEAQQQNQQNHNQTQALAAHTQFIAIPSAQVHPETNQVILLQQPILNNSQNTSKVIPVQAIQSGQGLGPVHVQYLQMDRDLLGPSVTETQSQQGTVVSEPSSECPTSKHHYSQLTNQQSSDAKSHFAVNSICFSDSILLPDDRNILSNVDDILAATVAACGVSPQDFVKATSSAEADMAVMASPIDSKGHFQTVDLRHMSPSFSSAQQPIITNTISQTITMTLNGPQMTTDCQGGSGTHNNNNELHANGDIRCSDNNYHSAGQVYDSSGPQNRIQGNAKCIKTDDGLMESPNGEDFTKKKARSKSLTKTGSHKEDGGLAGPAKRSGQTKRQNSRGSDVSSPSAAHGLYDGCPQQERIRQKIREVEEKQPEVKTGFIGSFLDFIKSGPKQQYSPSPTRTINRPRKACTSSKQCTMPALPPKLPTLPTPLIPQDSPAVNSQQKRLDEDLQKNLETLPSFSSDEEENTGKNQALRNSISSALSALDESSDRKTRTDNQFQGLMLKPEEVPSMPHAVTDSAPPVTSCVLQVPTPAQTTNAASGKTVFAATEESKETPPGQLAMPLKSVAMAGLTDEELSDSGGEGMYRERDEFVVRNEDIENLKVTMKAGSEPPAIWKVQKALLQKFVPELRDGKRVFSATNSYLGYFGDAKTMYQRVYVKFLDTVNKREYVRVCSQKPRCKPMNSLRGFQVKTLLGLTATPTVFQNQKPRPKQLKPRAEPPPKKRRKWKEEFSPTASGSSAEEGGEEDELNPPLPFASRLLNTRTMKETFRSFVELLISIALDEDVMTALERANDELLLPHMKRVDGMITDNRKRLLHKLHIEQVLKAALDSFPEISVVTELKKDGETPAFKVRLSGRAYNKKTMKPQKSPNTMPQEYTVDQQKTQWFSLYHSLQHYKYHTYLMCKDEIASLRVQAGDLGQEETVQKCLQNGAWVEGLFDRFGELINQVQQACR
uniref:Glutamine and serine rich 1 n=1 Tax=Maylandia zebra TaxID=106582 RepID=A0A3P9C1R0_9CICH|nr:glutamine and serine-rich protein 1 isoform X2 [Maylandia zebra]